MSPSFNCAAINQDNRTIAIDTYDMQLPPSSADDYQYAIARSDDSGSDGCKDSEGDGGAFKENCHGSGNISMDISDNPVFDVKLWDLGGQDVYMLSHAIHFTHRCVYMLLWKPFDSVDKILSSLFLWLESLCIHVPDAHIVLVGSHCKSIFTEDISELSAKIEVAARLKLQELNAIIKLEVDSLRSQLSDAISQRQLLQDKYKMTAAMSSDDAAFLLQYGEADGAKALFAARKEARPPTSSQMNSTFIHPPLLLPPLRRSLRTCAAEVHQAILREEFFRSRLQRLLGIRNGGSTDNRAACQMSLHCTSVDSVDGHGIRELRCWLYNLCRSLPFMGELISSNWIAIADVFKHFGDWVLSRTDAISLVRRHLPPLKYNLNVCDDEIWNIIEFWSLVGRIFVYDSQVLRNPSTLIALLKPLLHHQPLQMMRLPVYQNLLLETSLQRADTRVELSSMLNRLNSLDELPLQLLDHLSAWKDLSSEQRSSMLTFFERSHLLCRINERPNDLLITSRVRSKPHLTDDVDRVTAGAAYHALYLLPLNHVALIAHLQSTVCSLRLEHVKLQNRSGRDSLVLYRMDDLTCACAFSLESFAEGVERNQRFSSLSSKLGDPFSHVLRVATSDFGMFKFAAACVDDVLESFKFGTRYQCWVAVARATSSVAASQWTLFRDSSQRSQSQLQQQLLCSMSLSRALACNYHEAVIPGESILDMFQPRSNVFVSHAWGDGTCEFIQRLKTHLEQQTLANVWVDTEGLNQQQEIIIPAFRNALCQARVVVVVLTPTYLTRPNCLRELRWALDFERAGFMRVVLLSMHPAVTFDSRLLLAQDGPLRGLVFSLKEKKVKRLCAEAIALVERLNDVHMNTLPWHELQAWRSDFAKSDWEEHRMYLKGGADMTVSLAGGPHGLVEQVVRILKNWLICATPRHVSDCAAMDDTAALSASDVTSDEDVSRVLDLSRYPEEDAASQKACHDAAVARKFRFRCARAAAVMCVLVLLFLLLRAGKLRLRLRRLLTALLWLRRW